MAQLEINRSITTGFSLSHANNFLQTIPIEYYTARKISKMEIESEDSSKFYDLDSDILDVKSVKFKDSNQRYKAYELDKRKICFNASGIFIVEVEKFPDLITIETDIPDIDVSYHPAISKWMVYQEMARLYEEEDSSVKAKKEELDRLLETAHTQVRRMEKRSKKIRTQRW